ncbi:lamin tail domain-containing protein 2 [Pantherophis guttatus]|uniref:Lamin tail domain-containing protein 2 n=1 Tax=Pantherophis guttatus TaxID=94885 RepID=A0A6P9BYV8_PANGU|nr:lamin tail domain-containing protein 2 [Pantherophis guttatus]
MRSEEMKDNMWTVKEKQRTKGFLKQNHRRVNSICLLPSSALCDPSDIRSPWCEWEVGSGIPPLTGLRHSHLPRIWSNFTRVNEPTDFIGPPSLFLRYHGDLNKDLPRTLGQRHKQWDLHHKASSASPASGYSGHKMERGASPPWKAEEQLQKEEDGDDTNKHGVQWEENKKPYITRVSMMFYPGTGSRSDENFSVASSQSKLFKQKESNFLLQDSKLLENYRSLVLLLHQKDLEIQGLKNAAQNYPADRLSYILQEIVKSKHKGLGKKSPHEEALQKEVDQLNTDLKAVKEDYVQEIEDLKNELLNLKLHIKNLRQKIKTLGVTLDDENDTDSDISLVEQKKLACESFELWSEVGEKALTDPSHIRLRRIPKHTSFVDSFPKIQDDSLISEEREELINRITSDDLNSPPTVDALGRGSPESSVIESKLPSELSSQAIVTSLKSDFALSESKMAESSSSLPSLEDKGPEKKDLVSALYPSKLTQLGLSLGRLSEEELCPHLVHSPFLQECKRCHTETSSLRIISVHHKGKFIRIFNCLLTKEVDLSGYIIQQWVGGYPVSIYHFPKNVILPAQHHITVWAAGANLAHEPPSFSTTKFFRAGPECLTTLSDRNGQMVSQYVNPHQFTAAAAAYSDNVELSIDKFPIWDGREEMNEVLYSKISFRPRHSIQLSIDSSPSFNMSCDRSIGNNRKTNGESDKESSSDSEEDFSVMVFSHGNRHIRNQ